MMTFTVKRDLRKLQAATLDAMARRRSSIGDPDPTIITDMRSFKKTDNGKPRGKSFDSTDRSDSQKVVPVSAFDNAREISEIMRSSSSRSQSLSLDRQPSEEPGQRNIFLETVREPPRMNNHIQDGTFAIDVDEDV